MQDSSEWTRSSKQRRSSSFPRPAVDNSTTPCIWKPVTAKQEKLGWTAPLKDSSSTVPQAGLTARSDCHLRSHPVSKISKDGGVLTLDDQLQRYQLLLWRWIGSPVWTRTAFTLHFTIYLKFPDFGLVFLMTRSSPKLFWSRWVSPATQREALSYQNTAQLHSTFMTSFPITECITPAVSGNWTAEWISWKITLQSIIWHPQLRSQDL